MAVTEMRYDHGQNIFQKSIQNSNEACKFNTITKTNLEIKKRKRKIHKRGAHKRTYYKHKLNHR